MGIVLIDCRVDDFGYRSELRDCLKLRQMSKWDTWGACQVENGSGETLRSGSKHRLCYASHQLKRAKQGGLNSRA